MSILSEYQDVIQTCTFCPNLCRHTCPVELVEGRDTVSPGAKVSLAGHILSGRTALNEASARVFYKCSSCAGCVAFCEHDVPVGDVLFAARRHAVSAGVILFASDKFRADTEASVSMDEHGPDVLLFAGHERASDVAHSVKSVLSACAGMNNEDIGVAEASYLDTGFSLYAAGFEREFLIQAERVKETLDRHRHVVVMSPEGLYALKEIYPAYGLPLEVPVVHITEFLLSFLHGAIVKRVRGRVGLHDSCILARRLEIEDAPREVLERVLQDAPVPLFYRGADTRCCGGSGCLSVTSPETAVAMASLVIDAAVSAGIERLVTFAPECVGVLREAAGERVQVDDALTLVREAVRGASA